MKIAAISPPRLQTLNEGERAATWLELFYDLVFVAAVAMLGTRLVADTSFSGWVSYGAYFGMIWWLWASHTFYADRYDTNDLVYRLFTGAQMVAIAFLAVSVSTDHAGSTLAFAIAYAAARILLLALYARAYRHVAESRVLVRGYLYGFGAGAVLWTLSIFVPEPGRFWVWGAALAVDIATPYVMRRAQAAVPLDVSHFPERFGLFTILVLGETIVAVTVGLSHVEWQWSTSLTGIFGLLTATAVWWIHFDNVDGFVVRRRGTAKNWRPTVWIYSHLPLALGLAMMGVGVEHAIVAADHHHEYHDSERWLLVGGVAVALLAMAAIQTATVRRGGDDLRNRIVRNRLIAVPVVLLIGAIGSVGPVLTMVLVAFIIGGLVVADVFVEEAQDDAASGDAPEAAEPSSADAESSDVGAETESTE